jgi:hypothetical protein
MTKGKRQKVERTGRYKSNDWRDEMKMPKRVSKKYEKAWGILMSKDLETIRCYGVGYRMLWKIPVCKKRMLRHGFKPPEKYDPTSLMKGRVYGTPAEADFLNGKVCADILYDAYLNGATKSQLEKASRCFSLGYQLKTQKKGNFEEVTQLWQNNLYEYKMGKPTQSIIADVFLPASCVKKLFTTPWNPDCGQDLPHWCVGYLVNWFSIMMGARSFSDLERLKNSRTHRLCKTGGWLYTEYLGGRAKSEKCKGERPWKGWATCMCKAGVHCGLPEVPYKQLRNLFDAETGNPFGGELKGVNTACPIACFEIIDHWLIRSGVETNRIFPKWGPAQSMGNRKAKWKPKVKFWKDDIGMKSLHPMRFQWIELQGGNPDKLKLAKNSGRKTLGAVCEVFAIPEDVSFHLHGNQHKNWCYYQKDVRKVPGFSQRNQSNCPETCTEAHRMLRDAWGLGADKPPPPAPPQVTALKDELDEVKCKLNVVTQLNAEMGDLKTQMAEMRTLMMQQIELLKQQKK